MPWIKIAHRVQTPAAFRVSLGFGSLTLSATTKRQQRKFWYFTEGFEPANFRSLGYITVATCSLSHSLVRNLLAQNYTQNPLAYKHPNRSITAELFLTHAFRKAWRGQQQSRPDQPPMHANYMLFTLRKGRTKKVRVKVALFKILVLLYLSEFKTWNHDICSDTTHACMYV